MALDMVDRLILDTFVKLNESFFDDSAMPASLNGLSREQLFEGVVLLLWNCDPSTRSAVTSTKLPINMATRFRAATNVVDAIKAVGVRDDISYQTLLYGQAKEIRNVLIGLIEKLPTETPMITEEESPTLHLIRRAASRMGATEHRPQVAKYCFMKKRSWKCPLGSCMQFPFMGFNGDINKAMQCDLEWQRSVICSCLEANQLGSEVAPSERLGVQRVVEAFGNRSPAKAPKVVAPKPVPRGPKPPLPPKRAPKPSPREEEAVKEVDETLTKLHETAEELSLVLSRIEQKRNQLKKKQEIRADQSTRLEGLKEDEGKIDSRLIKLVESPEALAAITDYVENTEEAEKRAQNLQSRWIQAKAEKDEEIREARAAYDEKVKSGSLAVETAELLRASEELEKQLPYKQTLLQKLVKKAETLEQVPVNRSIYTKRIFEMVASIKKQRDEIEKVLKDNAQLQKEINSQNGKLDRTFTAVEDRLYKEAQRDPLMQKAYRLLVKIHEQCGLVIGVIESSGKAEREIDEINELIFTLEQRGLDEMLGKVLKDWTAVKAENEKLVGMLKGI